MTFTIAAIAASSLARPVVLIMFHKPAPPDTSMFDHFFLGGGLYISLPFTTKGTNFPLPSASITSHQGLQ